MHQPFRLNPIIIGLMLGMFLAAMDVTIVSTAMPDVIQSLGGFSLFAWVFSLYTLTSATSVPIYGKLADLYGRKSIYLIGIGLFVTGSLFAGLAQNMFQLILARGVQGLGAGSLFPMTSTIVGDLYTLEQRASVQGYLASVWGIAAIMGPALGGLIADHFHWRWIFLINIPFGLLSALVIFFFFHEKPRNRIRKLPIDYLGAISLTVLITAFLLLVLEGSREGQWLKPANLVLSVLAFVSLIVFLAAEHSAKEPIIPFELFRNRLMLSSNLGSLVAGGLTVGVSTFIPAYAQGVWNASATAAGAVIAAMSIGWPLASTLSGKLMLRWGYRSVALIGMTLDTLAVTALLLVGPQTSLFYVAAAMLLLGAGLGLSTNSLLIAVQNSVGWTQRGTATASIMFMRSLGSTLLVAILGAILNTSMTGYLSRFGVTVQQLPSRADLTNELLDPQRKAELEPELLEALITSFTHSLHQVFLWVALTSLIGIVIVLLLPKGRPEELDIDRG